MQIISKRISIEISKFQSDNDLIVQNYNPYKYYDIIIMKR
jgi:hypothetical protein